MTEFLPAVPPELARLQVALDAAEVGVWDWDVGTGELHWDERVCRLHGVDPEAFDSRLETFWECVHPDDLPALQASIAAALVRGGHFLQEFRVLRADGGTAWIQGRGAALTDEPGSVQRMVGIATDTTELRTARERAGRTLEHVSDGIIVFDRDWRLMFVNRQAGRLLRRDPRRLIGRNLWEEFPEAVGTPFWDTYQRAMTTQQAETFEAHYGALEGWFELRLFPAPDGLTIYFRDVNERRRAEQERATLIADLAASLRRGRRLFDVTQALASALTVDQVAGVVTAKVVDALGTAFAGIALYDDDRRLLQFVSMRPLPERTAATWRETRADLPNPVADAARLARPILHESREQVLADYPNLDLHLTEADTHALAHLPLMASGRVLGTLSLAWSVDHRFDEAEVSFLATLAGQCAQAIERSRLFEQQQHVAETLQRAILPLQLPRVPGLEVAARYQPAGHGVEVGGDWYDVFPVGDGRVALVVGDVGGHGVRAAALMGQLRNTVRAYAVDGHGPSDVISRLNRLLASETGTVVASCVYVSLDPDRGEITWSSAGHPPPLLVPASGPPWLLEQVHGPLLGVDPAYAFGEATEVLEVGGTLLLYTDGLVEHRRHSIEQGLEQLLSSLANARPEHMDALCDQVIADVLRGEHREDDVCLLAVHRLGGTG